MMSPGASLTGQSLTGLEWIGSGMHRGRAGSRQSRSGGLRHGKVQGLAQEPRIRSRAALIPKVHEKRPVRVGRKWVLVTTLFLMGGSMFAIGCLPTYEMLGIWAPLLL